MQIALLIQVQASPLASVCQRAGHRNSRKAMTEYSGRGLSGASPGQLMEPWPRAFATAGSSASVPILSRSLVFLVSSSLGLLVSFGRGTNKPMMVNDRPSFQSILECFPLWPGKRTPLPPALDGDFSTPWRSDISSWPWTTLRRAYPTGDAPALTSFAQSGHILHLKLDPVMHDGSNQLPGQLFDPDR